MPWIPMYIVESDKDLLLRLVYEEGNLFPIINGGPGKWKTTLDKSVLLQSQRSCLWDSASGPLPLVGAKPGDETTWITEPWQGWTEKRSGADPTQPFFGAGHPGIFWLNLNIRPRKDTNICGLSSFEWIGDHYKCIGNAASEDTRKCWKRLRSKIAKATIRVPRGKIASQWKPEIFAFPAAAQLLQSGLEADDNP